MKIRAVLFLITLFFACKTPTSTPPLESLDFTIVPGERIGLITNESCSREAVLSAYGDWAKVDTVYLIDGVTAEGVVLFPNDPKRTLHLYWDLDTNLDRPAFVRVIGDGNLKDGTFWKTADGITIGSSLAEVEKANGGPFDMFAFGSEYPGAVVDWKGGKLETLGMTFQPPQRVAMPQNLIHEETVSSADSLLQTITLVVSGLEVIF